MSTVSHGFSSSAHYAWTRVDQTSRHFDVCDLCWGAGWGAAPRKAIFRLHPPHGRIGVVGNFVNLTTLEIGAVNVIGVEGVKVLLQFAQLQSRSCIWRRWKYDSTLGVKGAKALALLGVLRHSWLISGY